MYIREDLLNKIKEVFNVKLLQTCLMANYQNVNYC